MVMTTGALRLRTLTSLMEADTTFCLWLSFAVVGKVLLLSLNSASLENTENWALTLVDRPVMRLSSS